jgi:CelD/BcsL family acetyltransferase involved in cellulose biosynthesis
MERSAVTHLLTFEDLDAARSEYDDAVATGITVDRFCSSSFWILPAARFLSPQSSPRIVEENGSYAVLARSEGWLHPLEATWGLCCPLVGAVPEAAVELFVHALERERGWSAALATGIWESSPPWRLLSRTLARRYTVERGPTTRRYVACLADGVAGFLERRPASLRKNLERASRRAERAGLTFEVKDRGAESFERVLAIERRSWKGVHGVGIDREPMRSFYRNIDRRLLDADRRRLLFARLEGEDVAYIFGGVFSDTYRGLQFSFDSRFSSLSLGNLCQLEEVRRLVESGVRRYDLGSEVRYKQRWGEEVVETGSLVIRR